MKTPRYSPRYPGSRCQRLLHYMPYLFLTIGKHHKHRHQKPCPTPGHR